MLVLPSSFSSFVEPLLALITIYLILLSLSTLDQKNCLLRILSIFRWGACAYQPDKQLPIWHVCD